MAVGELVSVCMYTGMCLFVCFLFVRMNFACVTTMYYQNCLRIKFSLKYDHDHRENVQFVCSACALIGVHTCMQLEVIMDSCESECCAREYVSTHSLYILKINIFDF